MNRPSPVLRYPRHTSIASCARSLISERFLIWFNRVLDGPNCENRYFDFHYRLIDRCLIEKRQFEELYWTVAVLTPVECCGQEMRTKRFQRDDSKKWALFVVPDEHSIWNGILNRSTERHRDQGYQRNRRHCIELWRGTEILPMKTHSRERRVVS